MSTPNNVCYGSVGAFNSVGWPSRRKKGFAFILAALGALFCAALIFSGSSLFSSRITENLSELLVPQKPFKSPALQPRQDAQIGNIANWGNQTPTAKIHAQHVPVRDGVVDFYLNFPSGSSKLRAPHWFMGIPVKGRKAAALKQVEIAFLDGQINHLPAASKSSFSPNRKLLELTKKGSSKFSSKAQPNAANPKSDEEESGTIEKGSPSSKVKSIPSTSKPVNCCLPECAKHKKIENLFIGCQNCRTKPDIDQCTNIKSFQNVGGFNLCKKLFRKNRGEIIKDIDIVPLLFDAKSCVNFGGSPAPPILPLTVPSCAIDQNSKFAGCAVCSNAQQFPAEDLCICNNILSKSQPLIGVTVVIRSNELLCPKALAPPTTSAPVTSKDVSNPKQVAKVCSHDLNKMNGNGQGCASCQGKRPTAATADLPGNDYWACSQCRDKGICDFTCKMDKNTMVWQCSNSIAKGNTETASARPEPECLAGKNLNWVSSSNMLKCQGFMCKKAGLLPSGEIGLVSYPKMNSYPSSLDAQKCCPFVAQGLNSEICYQKFGCEVPSVLSDSNTEWTIQDQVKSCMDFFCLLGVSSPADWSQKQGDSLFASGKNKGRSACCSKMLAGVPDGKGNWCPTPALDPTCAGPHCEPIVPMDAVACQSFLCQQLPMISNVDDSYALWLESHRSSESRRLLNVAAASHAASSTAQVAPTSGTERTASTSSSTKTDQNTYDPNVARCIRTLQLSRIESWEINEHCVNEEDKTIEQEGVQEEKTDGSEPSEGAGGPSGIETSHADGISGKEVQTGAVEGSDAGEKVSEVEVLERPEIEPEEIPEVECDAEEGHSNLPLLPGADVLGYTYDPDFGMKGCTFDRCVMRPFIKFTYKDCKVVATPAGIYKLPDQIYAYNLFETSAKTHIYQNEKEERASFSAEATISGSYGPGSASVSMAFSQSGDSKSKQHVAVRKIDVHLYRLTLMSSPSFDNLSPVFLEAFKSLPARFEDNAHGYLKFAQEWGRYVPSSGTFGGSLEIKMKFFTGEETKKEDFSMGVEAAYDGGVFSVSGSAKAGYSKEAKSLENENEISIDSSGGDPGVASLIADLKSPEEMSYRDDVEKWLVSIPKFPRLVEDWPILQVLTVFIPNSPTQDGSFDPFTRKQGLLQALRILHDVDAKKFFDERKCYPAFSVPTSSPSSSAPSDSAGVTMISNKGKPPAYKDGAVQLFHHKNFQGKQLALPEGNFDCDELRDMDFDWVRSISSLKVKDDYVIYVWDKPGFQGGSTSYSGEWSTLKSWNDKIESIRVVSNANYEKEKFGWQNGEMSCDKFGAKKARKLREAEEAAAAARSKIEADVSAKAQVELINSRKKKPLPSGRTSISFNDFDRMNVGQCLSFDAMSKGGIYVYLFASPVSQSNAYSFHVGTKEVRFEKGLSGTVIKKTDDPNALAFGQNQLSQNVWFCVYADSEDSSITVFSYGRGSHTLFEVTQKDPVMINFFAMDCSQESTYRNVAVLAAPRFLDSVTSFNRACKIVNCEIVQAVESESGDCACKKCDFGYMPYNNNQECVIADQCVAQFGCLVAAPPLCTCQECCCGLSYDPVTNNCVNANLLSGPEQDAIVEPGLPKSPLNTLAVNTMATSFKPKSSYRLKKLLFSCTETNVQNIRLSYDASKPALGFIDYDSTHLIKQSDPAGIFDFSMYDNLRQSVAANPLYSASGFLNLDEVKLEKFSLSSIAKKSSNALKNTFKFITEGAKLIQKYSPVNVAIEIAKDLTENAKQFIKIADGEVKKFMNAAKKAYRDVVSLVQKISQGAVNFAAENADLLKTIGGIAGQVGGALVSVAPQLMNAIPGCQVWCGVVVSAVGNAAVAAGSKGASSLIDMAVESSKSGKNPMAFLSQDLKGVPKDIMDIAGPLLERATKNLNAKDVMQFNDAGGASDIMNSITRGGLNNFKGIFNDPGLSKISGDFFAKRSLLSANDRPSSEWTQNFHEQFSDLNFLGNFAASIASSTRSAFAAVSSTVDDAQNSIKSQVSKAVENIGDVHKKVAGNLDAALGTDAFSKASNAVHKVVAGGINTYVDCMVDGCTGTLKSSINRMRSFFDPNKSKLEYMNSQEYKDKMAANSVFKQFSTKLDLPSNMPKYLTDSIVQWIMGEIKVTPLGKQPFLTNLNSDKQCVSMHTPNTCNEEDIKCIVLANKCFLDDEECVRAALQKVPTASLEKYAANQHLDFPGSSYGRYIRFSAPKCKKRALSLGGNAVSDDEQVKDEYIETMSDAESLFANQTELVFGLSSKFWRMPKLSKTEQSRKTILNDISSSFDTLIPVFQGHVSSLNFSESGSPQTFAGSLFANDFIAQFSGDIFVPITGNWTFRLTSRDGSRLYVDGNEVVDNDGYHEMVTVSQSAILSRGMHSIKVSCFQNSSSAGLILAWSGPRTSLQIIPREYFLFNSKFIPLSIPRESSCDMDNNLQISQIAVFDPYGINVALNKPCDVVNLIGTDRLIPYLAASPQNVFSKQNSECSRAVDGKLANRNGDNIFQSTDPDSDVVTYDLGKDIFIKRIMYWNRLDCCQSMISGATLEIITANGDVVNSEVLNNRMIQSFEFPVSQSRATLFTNCNYGGNQIVIGPGNYELRMLQIPSNSLSSIKLPDDLEIKLFQGESFDGPSTPWLSEDVPCLVLHKFDDRTSSVQVRERSKLNGLKSNEVVFYDACDFQGNSMTLIPGTYSVSQLSLTRNSIMSVLVPSELEVELYSFDNLGGRASGWLQKSFSCLSDIDFSRTTVSLQIRKRTTNQNRKLLSSEQGNRVKLISIISSHAAAQHAFYLPKNGDSESSKKVLRAAVRFAHDGVKEITESHMHHREMVSGIAKWVPHQYVLSALKMDLEQNSATSAIAQAAIDRVHKSLFTRLTEIVDTAAQNSLNVLDQTVVNILGEAYAPVTLPGPCFSRDLIMSYLPTKLRVGIDTWMEMQKFSWIQEIRVNSVDVLLKDPKVVQSEKYSVKTLSFKVSQYRSSDKNKNDFYHLVRSIHVTYQKSPSFGGPGDLIKTHIGKINADKRDSAPITNCKSIEFEEGEFMVGMSVVTLPEGLAGINSVMTNKREISADCGQKASTATDMTSDDGVVWMNCDAGYDVVGIGGKFDSRVIRTVELLCSPTSQADRVQFLGVYSYSFETDEFFNGIGADSPGYKSGFWAVGEKVGITRKEDKDYSEGWNLRIWTNRVPFFSPVTGAAPMGIVSSARSDAEDKAAQDKYRKISESNDLVSAMAPPDDKRWYFDSEETHYTDIIKLSFAEDSENNGIRGVYVDYSARSDLYSGYMLNSQISYKNLRVKTLKLERNEYWTGLKVGVDPLTGAVSCIIGVKTSIKEYGILIGSRDSGCHKMAGWMDCPSNTPMMVALQEDFNDQNGFTLIGITPICASMKATRFNINEFTVMFEEDEFMNQMTVRRGLWLDSIIGVNTNKRNIPLQCGRMDGDLRTEQLTLPGQFLEQDIKKSKAVIGFQVDVVVDDNFGVFADTQAIQALSLMQQNVSPEAAKAINTAKRSKNRGPGPTIIDIKMMSLTFDADPLSAIILESPEEVGRSRIPEFYSTGIYTQLTFDMAFDFFKPRMLQFQQMLSFEFQCERGRSTSKDFWMPWFQFSFTSGDTYSQGEKSSNQLAVNKRLLLSAEEYMVRFDVSSHKDKGYAITAIKTNKNYYRFRCGDITIALDVPPGDKHLFIGLAGNLKTAADSTFFANLQALHLKLNAFADEPPGLANDG